MAGGTAAAAYEVLNAERNLHGARAGNIWVESETGVMLGILGRGESRSECLKNEMAPADHLSRAPDCTPSPRFILADN